MDFGLFQGGFPKLSKRRWTSLVRKRAVHIVIVALNYIYGGLCRKDFHLLGRCPNAVQKDIHRRLWTLVTMCDSPGLGSFPAVPGRSGPEFIARLAELEDFAVDCPFFDVSAYANGPCDFEVSPVGKAKVDPSSLPVQPYSSLDAGRLKLVGEGKWHLEEFLHDELWLPYVEPKILHHGLPLDASVGPNLSKESRAENLKLAKIWDAKGLLAVFEKPPHEGAFTRIFNAFKSPTVDRQIGDRRLANATERSIRGPSQFLPGGYLMTGIHVPKGSLVLGSITDRKDFYHQSWVTFERAATNILPFLFTEAELAGTFCLRRQKPRGRDEAGDRLGKADAKHSGVAQGYYVGFKSLLQGDHLGVEFALAAHASLLKQEGLLRKTSHVQGHHPFPLGPSYEGLVIDDYFTLSVGKDSQQPSQSQSSADFHAAREAYDKHEVLGSPEKDIESSRHFKVVGAEIDSSKKAISNSFVGVSAPVEKRAALAALTLRVAQLPVISATLAQRLAGNWTSIFMFRRCLSCILSRIYAFGADTAGGSETEVYSLPRKAADELVLASVVAWVASTDVSVKYSSKVYATDASMQKGAIVSRNVSPTTAKVLWLGGDKRGAYTMLDTHFRSLLKSVGGEDDDQQPAEFSDPPRPCLEFYFDFVEICAGVGSVSKEMQALGFAVCPPIELSDSPHFDVRDLRLIEWIMFMLEKGRILSLMAEPVCTTFSPAAHPCVRSYSQPLGFDRSDKKTLHGNLIAFRCLFLLWFASICKRPALGEQPRLSKMAWLSAWRFLCSQKGFAEAIVASCQFGSPHRKEFRMLGWGIDMQELEVRCPGGHSHVPIEGKYTKPSAIYVPELARHFALSIAKALRRQKAVEAASFQVGGIESVVANDLLLTGSWEVELQWKWQHAAHINLLESHSFVTLLKLLALEGGDERFTALLDSRVAKCSHAKGRSSARALMPSLKKSAALQVAAGLYPSYGFAPTRLNVADAPTRDNPLPETAENSLTERLDVNSLRTLHSLCFSRVAAAWIRMVLLLLCMQRAESVALEFPCLGLKSCPSWPRFLDFTWVFCGIGSALLGATCLCGFLRLLTCGSSLSTLRVWRFCWILSWFVWGNPVVFGNRPESHEPQPLPRAWGFWGVSAMPLGPSGADEQRKAERRASSALHVDRVLRPQTRSRRETLLDHFSLWLAENYHISFEDTVGAKEPDVEEVSNLLVEYGKQLYYAGKPYGRFAETINAVAMRRPLLRRQLAGPWDLAFSWVSDEPHSHHPAMPLAVLLAFASLAILWGWPEVAAIVLLTWSGLLRIGEVLSAQRSDLILPEDSAPGIEFVLLQIRQPKTRGTGARHQAARVDPIDIVQFLSSVYRKRPSHERLWRSSPATLRKRFGELQKALGLPTVKSPGVAPFDLASLRPGGATFLLHRFEDSELVRRRGRWASARVMEIYLQEVAVSTYSAKMPKIAFQRVEALSIAFEQIRLRAINFLKNDIPPGSWPILW